jgi:hypothetical protein
MPGVGHGRAKAKVQLAPGTDRKKSRLSRTRQDLWEETSWSDQRWSRAAPTPRGTRARGPAHGRVRKSWTRGGSWEQQGLEGDECISKSRALVSVTIPA